MRMFAAVRYDTGLTGSIGTGHTGAGGPAFGGVVRCARGARQALRPAGAEPVPGLVLRDRVAGV